MATINVKDAAGSTVALEKPLAAGQAAMVASRPVVLASDQSSIPVAATLAAETTKVIGTVRTASGGIASGSVASGAVASGAYAAGSLAAGAGVDGWDLTKGAITDAAVTAGATGSISAKLRSISRDIVANIVLAAGTAIIGKVGIDQTTDGTTNKVAADVRLAGTAADKGVGTGGSATQRVAIDSSQIAANTAPGTDASALVGIQGAAGMSPITVKYADSGNIVSGAITSAMTGTTSTSLVAAPGASLRNYITTLIVSNSHATVGTDIVIQDGSGGTTLLTIPAAAVYGGAVITLPTPLRQPTTNTALFCANVTTGASTKVSAVGFKAA